MRIIKILLGRWFHFHNWEYYKVPRTIKETNIHKALKYPINQQVFQWSRKCVECEKIQALDIDGWCEFMYEDEENEEHLRMLKGDGHE